MHAIVEKYGMATADAGQIFRQRWLAKWLTIAEYDKLIETNPQEDRDMEDAMKHIVESCPGDIILSWRMWFHLMPDITSVRLNVSPEQWAERIFEDDRWAQEKKYATVQEALQANHDRMERLRQRLLRVYGVDFTDTSHYTKVIDTTDKPFEEVLEEFEEFMKTLK